MPSQPSSEKLPYVANKNKYKDLQPDNMQRMRDLGIFSSKRDFPTKFLLSQLMELLLREGGKSVKARRLPRESYWRDKSLLP